jgi:signal transduction histidine kinase
MKPETSPAPGTAAAESALDRSVSDAVAAMVFERSRSSNLLGVPVALLLVWLLWGAVPAGTLLAWLALKVLATAWRVLVMARYDRDGREQLPRWRRHFLVALAADGAVFGLLGTWLLPAQDPVLEVVLVATLLGIAALALVVLSASLQASLMLTVPVLLPALVVQLLHADKVSIYLAAGMAVFLGLVVVEGRRASAHTAAMLRLKFSADELAAQRQAALAQAERSNAVKGRFLATMSHEMRTPLHGILGLASMLRQDDDAGAPEARRERLQTLQHTGEHLLALINDVLDLAKVEAGRMRVRPDVLNVPALCEQAAALFRPQAEKKEIELLVQVPPDTPDVRQDGGKLRQILSNLLSNAVKFTPEGGRITVRASADADTLTLSVTDTGVGIAPEHQEMVFQKFRQASGTLTREQGGTGLGLSIVREMARLLGGDVRLHSEVGRGSTFTVRVAAKLKDDPLAAFSSE